jgi:hypothetical protein
LTTPQPISGSPSGPVMRNAGLRPGRPPQSGVRTSVTISSASWSVAGEK